MIVGIMQPYFMPYIGYFQLINAVDVYVIYDDVNYIKGGYVNRNSILVENKPTYINVELKKASQNKHINEIEVTNNIKHNKKLIKTIERSYKKAPYYEIVYKMFCDIMNREYSNLAEINVYSIKKICEYLGINTKIILSSDIDKDNNLRAQEKIIDICKRLKANKYYNAIGGRKLYDTDKFLKNGIELKFIRTRNIVYKQYKNEFIKNLSILDVMMFNSIKQIKEDLNMYDLV